MAERRKRSLLEGLVIAAVMFAGLKIGERLTANLPEWANLLAEFVGLFLAYGLSIFAIDRFRPRDAT